MDFIGYQFQLNSQQQTAASITSIVVYIFYVIVLWSIFHRAGKPGILALIPIVNVIYYIKVSGHTGWWVLLIWVPILGWILSIVFALDLARRFGHGGAFGFFLVWLLAPIGLLILAFSSNKYQPKAVTA